MPPNSNYDDGSLIRSIHKAPPELSGTREGVSIGLLVFMVTLCYWWFVAPSPIPIGLRLLALSIISLSVGWATKYAVKRLFHRRAAHLAEEKRRMNQQEKDRQLQEARQAGAFDRFGSEDR